MRRPRRRRKKACRDLYLCGRGKPLAALRLSNHVAATAAAAAAAAAMLIVVMFFSRSAIVPAEVLSLRQRRRSLISLPRAADVHCSSSSGAPLQWSCSKRVALPPQFIVVLLAALQRVVSDRSRTGESAAGKFQAIRKIAGLKITFSNSV